MTAPPPMTESALVCVTGRFQPVHDQHLELFEVALRDADHLVVAITNPDSGDRHEAATSAHRHRDSANPFTYFERIQLLTAALSAYRLAESAYRLADRTTIVPFALTRPQQWHEYVPLRARQFVRAYSDWERHKAGLFAEAGYPVELIEGDPAERMSASAIRERIDRGEHWEDLVPAAVVPVLRSLLHGAVSGSGGAL